MSSSPNLAELKQCLQEAGMYEENMNEDEMRSYYNAIKSSESTAKEEDEQRNTDTSFQADITYDKNNGLEIEESILDKEESMLVEEESIGDSKKDSKDDIDDDQPILDPLNCPPITHRLTFIHRSPDYMLLPPHIDPKLVKLSVEKRAKIISAFHKDLLRKFYDVHKRSKILAPWGKPLYSSEISKDWIDKSNNSNAYDISFIDQDSDFTQETYTSRAGRQTKRKVYIEEVDSDSDKKRTKKGKESEYKPISKRQNAGKLSNPEIMKRSKFFADTTKSPRSEAMFNQLAVFEKKQQQEEEKIESFKQTLQNADEDDEDIIPASPSQSIVDNGSLEELKESPVIRRRIPPPIHGRRGIGVKKTSGVTLSEIDKVKPPETSTKPIQRNTPAKTNAKLPQRNTKVDNKDKNPKEMTKCPICSEFFHKDEVEAHASNCGVGMETSVTLDSVSDTSMKTLQCRVCDKRMLMNTDYEIHVAECIRWQQMKNS